MAEIAESPTLDIQIRPLLTVQDAQAASVVLASIWADATVMPVNTLRALSYSGNYAMGIYADDRLVGASAGFFAEPWARILHSHITGVLPEFQGQGLGRIVKNHQREWALSRDINQITWTFDPLIARNATFNLNTVGARVTEYLPDHYGNASGQGFDQHDRLMVTWDITEPPPPSPDEVDAVATVAIPADIEQLRGTDPAEAARVRDRARAEFVQYLAEDLVVAGFHAPRGYLFVAADLDA